MNTQLLKQKVLNFFGIETTAQEAKRLLESVSADEFITGKLSDNKGKCCALGHYIRLKSSNPDNYNSIGMLEDKDGNKLNYLGREFLQKKHNISAFFHRVNDFTGINGYNESIIKERVIHLLDDMIKEGY